MLSKIKLHNPEGNRKQTAGGTNIFTLKTFISLKLNIIGNFYNFLKPISHDVSIPPGGHQNLKEQTLQCMGKIISFYRSGLSL